MIEFDATIRAMGLYKYIIYAFERAAIIAAINFNKEEMKTAMKDANYHRKNIAVFAEQLKEHRYEKWAINQPEIVKLE